MSRPLRIDYPDAWHHVMNRARKGMSLFEDDTDYQQFLDLLQETAKLFHVKVAAFCLMRTHYHLLVQTPHANLSRCMRHLNGVYTQRYNFRHDQDGTLFRGRYRSILVDADSYVLQLVRYIHLNPLKAGLVTHLDQYAWSSHEGYLSSARKWDWLYRNFVLEMLTPLKSSRISLYREFMGQREDEDLALVLEGKRLPPILGGDTFVDWVKDRFFEEKTDHDIPASKDLAPDMDTILSEVIRHYGLKRSALMRVRRGRENEPRDVAMYLIRTLRSEPLMKVGAGFGLHRYSSVSSVVTRIKNRLQKDKQFKKRLTLIEKDILKGQS